MIKIRCYKVEEGFLRNVLLYTKKIYHSIIEHLVNILHNVLILHEYFKI
jgi:hypothetical protein